MASYLSRAANIGTDPIAQAVNVYATLSKVKNDSDEMDLRRNADARETRESAIRMRGLSADQEWNTQQRGRQTEAQGREDQAREYRLLVAQLQQGLPFSAEQLEKMPAQYRALLDIGRKENPAQVLKAYEAVGAGMDEIKTLGATSPISLRRTAKNEEFFQSLERMSADRRGAVHDYDALDMETGAVRSVKGEVGQIVNVLYDPKQDAVGVNMSVVDPETKQPLIGKDGNPILVPATAGRTSDPKDPIQMIPREQVKQAAQFSTMLNKHYIGSLENQSRLMQEKILLVDSLRYSNEFAPRLAELNKSLAYVKEARRLAADPNVGVDEQQKFKIMADRLEGGQFTVEEADKLATTAMKAQMDKTALAKTIAAEDRKLKGDKELQALKNDGAVAAAKVGDNRDDARLARAIRTSLETTYRTAYGAVVNAKKTAAKEFFDSLGKEYSPARRAYMAADEKTRKEMLAAAVADNPGVESANEYLTEVGHRFEAEGIPLPQEKDTGDGGDVDLSKFLTGLGAAPDVTPAPPEPPQYAPPPGGGAIPMPQSSPDNPMSRRTR
ncbi:MAG: hypothetical protein P1P84_02625 [Deferrisomatales bacterium]|nr:hypothetical protein [Deferrisomatales bacterium]